MPIDSKFLGRAVREIALDRDPTAKTGVDYVVKQVRRGRSVLTKWDVQKLGPRPQPPELKAQYDAWKNRREAYRNAKQNAVNIIKSPGGHTALERLEAIETLLRMSPLMRRR